MTKLYYEKRGHRYLPVAEYNEEWLDSFRKGTHIVMCYPGGQSRRYNIDPAHAPLIAAGRVAEDAMCRAIREASEMRPQKNPITSGQKKAWERLAQEFGDELATLQVNSAHDIARAGVQAMIDEAHKLMQNESVRRAYDHFLLVCELTRNPTT